MADRSDAPRASRPQMLVLVLTAAAPIVGTTLFAKALGSDAPGQPLHTVQVIDGWSLFALMALSSAAATILAAPHLANNGIGLGVVLPVWQVPTPCQWAGLAGLGIAMALPQAQTFYINALAWAAARLVTPFTYATLVLRRALRCGFL